MIEAVKWTIRDGYLLAAHLAVSETVQHIGVLTVDGWVDSPVMFPLAPDAQPDPAVHFACASNEEALALLEGAGVDLSIARQIGVPE